MDLEHFESYRLAERDLETFGSRSICLFFLANAVRLSPLYAHFCNNTAWGNHSALKRAHEFVYASLTDPAPAPASAATARELWELVPDIDRFDNYTASMAMDAVAVAESAIDWITASENRSTSHLQYCYYPVLSSVLLTHADCLDLGDTKVAEQQLADIKSDPRTLAQEEEITHLLRLVGGRQPDRELVDVAISYARENEWDFERISTTPRR